MSDFKLSDALNCSSEDEENFSFKAVENIRINEELEMQISRDQKTMKKIVTLVLIMNKFVSECNSKLRDVEVCSSIMEHVVEETVMENWSLGQKKVVFVRSNSEGQCMLTDTSQKNFILNSACEEQFKLEAIVLRAGHSDLRVNFKMSRYVAESEDFSAEGICVLLSIKEKNMHISCSKIDEDKIVLNLEECTAEKLQRTCADTNRFLFIRRTTGMSLNTFESVKYPGWFISTSFHAMNNSVEMCKRPSTQSQRNCDFKVYEN